MLIGWVSARVERLESRPLQCYRCLEFGHVRQRCTGEVNRTGECYRCGGDGHTAAGYVAAPCCPLCAARGRPSDHRMGGKGCAPPTNNKSAFKKAGGGESRARAAGASGPPKKGEKIGATTAVPDNKESLGRQGTSGEASTTLPRSAPADKGNKGKEGRKGAVDKPSADSRAATDLANSEGKIMQVGPTRLPLSQREKRAADEVPYHYRAPYGGGGEGGRTIRVLSLRLKP